MAKKRTTKRRKTAKPKAPKRARRVRRAARSRAAAQPAGHDQALGSLQQYHKSLLTQRSALDSQINLVDQAIKAMQASPLAAPTSRPPTKRGASATGRYRTGSLKEHLEQILHGRGAMSVKDITNEVMSSGYKSRNKTLAKSVGLALTQMPNVAKVARGQFRLR